MISANSAHFVLGLDIGAESIGWALLTCRQGEPSGVLAAGVRCFDAGVEGDYESGRDESRATPRRQARLSRRQHWRRARRLRKLLRLLQRHGLLPEGDIRTPQEIHEFLLRLDETLRRKHLSPGDRRAAHTMPYRLRTLALDKKLEPHELGRALYHLAQRRGFLSNRKIRKKADEDKEDERSKVKAGINELAGKIAQSGARTLGEYFASLDPEEERIRKRWTSRPMYEAEFEAIWSSQARFHEGLDDTLKKSVHDAIFFQRPLKSQKGLIGECMLRPGKKVAPMALRVAQRFRMLQKVNDLLVYMPDGRQRALTREERDKLIEALDRKRDLTFAAIRSKRVLGLPKETGFNLQEGGEKKLPGNRTDAKLREIFENRWDTLTEQQRDAVVEDVLSIDKDETLARRAQRVWGLDREKAGKLSQIELEAGYAPHCRTALRILVDRMEEGAHYATARKEEFPEQFDTHDPLDALPPVYKALSALRNPAVCRTLTELRKLVNAIVRKYGKPDMIRIELARDLKQPRKIREKRSKENRQRQGIREAAIAEMLRQIPGLQPKGDDIEKWLLAEECGWKCPYTGKVIDARSLLGDAPQFDVEHIWPMCRSMDNSFFNKTLCYHEENRHGKCNRTPFEAYGANTARWEEILQRVRKFKGDAARTKLKRFEATEIPEGFVARHLNDTRIASKWSGDYLALLYGGRSDADGKMRIQVCTGGLTHHLRNGWMLNDILNSDGRKERKDHREHAIDAIVTALSEPRTVKMLADAAEHPEQHRRKLFASIPYPWNGFHDDVRKAIQDIRVSRHVNRKLSGALHEDTNYSKAHHYKNDKGRVMEYRHVRKPLSGMSSAEIDSIVDPVVRKHVKEKMHELKGTDGKVFTSPQDHPVMKTRDGRYVPIKKARIRMVKSVIAVGEDPRTRYVAPGANHHMVIVAVLDRNGHDSRWEGHIVTRYEAAQRHQHKLPVVQKEWGEGRAFRFSIVPGEQFTLLSDTGQRQLYTTRSISRGRIEFVQANDARRKTDIKKAGGWLIRSPNELRKMELQKVVVNHLGEVLPAHD